MISAVGKEAAERQYARVLERCHLTPSGCLEFTGTHMGMGYGQSSYQGRRQPAHRIVWQHLNGPIPDGMLVCHTCDNPPCCNIDHLWLGTHADNMRDCIQKGRAANGLIPGMGAAAMRARTHCVHEHEFTPENTFIRPDGSRRCRECSRLRNRRDYYAVGRGRYVKGTGRRKPKTAVADEQVTLS